MRAHPLRSIMTRIFAGFFLVLLLLAVMAAMVWRAGHQVGQVLRADELSQAADVRIDQVQGALTEARLRMAAYLRTEGAAERGALAVAIDRLQAAADMRNSSPQDIDLSSVAATIQPVRAALSNVAEAIAARRSAVAALVAASAALSNSSTALAENAARLGDSALAGSGAALMADVARAIMTDGRGATTEDALQLAAATAVIDHGKQIVAAMAEASAGSPRLQRLATTVGADLDTMRTAVTNVQATNARRSTVLSMLTKTASQAAASAGEQARAITAERTMRREHSMAAQRSLQTTVLETAVVACILGLVIALGLGLSITRPLRRLALAVRGLADGALDTVVPGITKHDEFGVMAGALMALKDRSAHLTTHDSLTGLPNRVLFQNCLDHSLAWSRRHGGTLAVIFIDLDHFKDVNDTLGHSAGDQLLVQVAERLGGSLRETDVLARLGGDEFAIIQVDAHRPADVEIVAQRIVDALSKAFDVNGQTMTLGTSAGISVRSETELKLSPCDAGVLLQEADVALYRAKEEGRGTYRFFAAAMNAMLQERRALENDLREALENCQFSLHYQPQFDLADRRIVGAEALIRWSHPRRGEVSPGEFIPLAEQTGLVIQIGEWVLLEACRQAAAWPELGRMAVNVSPVQFRRPGFVELVQHALQHAGLAPQRLELEITEGVLLTETPETLSILHRLRRLGVTIAMDDFGTGYSSLGYLQKFRFDKIKIDRSFVSNIGKDPKASEIVRAVLRMSHAMGIRVNAEGVEQQEQIPTLQQEGCEEVQGFLFGRPLPADEFAERLACPATTVSH
jgi:diguanylate cyclase (GGDEF)-like protein